MDEGPAHAVPEDEASGVRALRVWKLFRARDLQVREAAVQIKTVPIPAESASLDEERRLSCFVGPSVPGYQAIVALTDVLLCCVRGIEGGHERVDRVALHEAAQAQSDEGDGRVEHRTHHLRQWVQGHEFDARAVVPREP